MRVVVSGSTGFIGRPLCTALALRGDEVVALTRNLHSPAALALARQRGVSCRQWDGRNPGPALRSAMEGADAVINLAGEPLFARRWTARQKERLRTSRTEATRALVDAASGLTRPLRTFVSASAVGYYGDRGDQVLDESSPPGTDFLARLCLDWEAEALRAQSLGARTVIVRIGVVLGENGGALEQLLRAFRLYAGGPVGSGRQWMSWIHREDLLAALLFLLDGQELGGAFNAVAPEPRTNRDFSSSLGRVIQRPSWLPVPPLALRAALGEVATTVLASQRVVPAALLRAGFVFSHPHLDGALRDVLS